MLRFAESAIRLQNKLKFFSCFFSPCSLFVNSFQEQASLIARFLSASQFQDRLELCRNSGRKKKFFLLRHFVSIREYLCAAPIGASVQHVIDEVNLSYCPGIRQCASVVTFLHSSFVWSWGSPLSVVSEYFLYLSSDFLLPHCRSSGFGCVNTSSPFAA